MTLVTYRQSDFGPARLLALGEIPMEEPRTRRSGFCIRLAGVFRRLLSRRNQRGDRLRRFLCASHPEWRLQP